jgi:hypothetical protein
MVSRTTSRNISVIRFLKKYPLSTASEIARNFEATSEANYKSVKNSLDDLIQKEKIDSLKIPDKNIVLYFIKPKQDKIQNFVADIIGSKRILTRHCRQIKYHDYEKPGLSEILANAIALVHLELKNYFSNRKTKGTTETEFIKKFSKSWLQYWSYITLHENPLEYWDPWIGEEYLTLKNHREKNLNGGRFSVVHLVELMYDVVRFNEKEASLRYKPFQYNFKPEPYLVDGQIVKRENQKHPTVKYIRNRLTPIKDKNGKFSWRKALRIQKSELSWVATPFDLTVVKILLRMNEPLNETRSYIIESLEMPDHGAESEAEIAHYLEKARKEIEMEDQSTL